MVVLKAIRPDKIS